MGAETPTSIKYDGVEGDLRLLKNARIITQSHSSKNVQLLCPYRIFCVKKICVLIIMFCR